MAKDAAFRSADAQRQLARQAFNDSLAPILSEHGIESGIAKEVTTKPPYELVVEVRARTKKE